MGKQTEITPPGRLEAWKKLWATPAALDEEATEAAFEEFLDAMVPSHMHKRFLKLFGVPKSEFGNRYFSDDATFHRWETRFSALGAGDEVSIEATVIYASPDALQGHRLKGQSRRTIRDLFIDDWHAACAVVSSPHATFYLFIEPKMRGCIVLPLHDTPDVI